MLTTTHTLIQGLAGPAHLAHPPEREETPQPLCGARLLFAEEVRAEDAGELCRECRLLAEEELD